MSLIARLLIAIFAGLCGAGLFIAASGNWLCYFFGIFCIAIALVCFVRGRRAHFIGGLIATSILASAVGYLAHALMHGPVMTARQSDVSVFNAVCFLVVFAVPAAKYVRATRFGFVPPPRPIKEQMAVEFDDLQVRTRVLDGLDERLNQSFDWSGVVRVCFRDEGLMSSDLLFIQVCGRPVPIVVPTEAAGAAELLGELAKRGLFPEEVWRKAMGESGGRTHCWPPHVRHRPPREAA